MGVRMRAGLVARRWAFVILIVIELILIERRVVPICSGSVFVGRVAVQPVNPMSMRVERRQHARIAVDAADADRDGNHKKAQELASQ